MWHNVEIVEECYMPNLNFLSLHIVGAINTTAHNIQVKSFVPPPPPTLRDHMNPAVGKYMYDTDNMFQQERLTGEYHLHNQSMKCLEMSFQVTRKHSSRMRTTCSPRTCFSSQPPDVSTDGCPEMNMFKEAPSLGHQMPLARQGLQVNKFEQVSCLGHSITLAWYYTVRYNASFVMDTWDTKNRQIDKYTRLKTLPSHNSIGGW